MLSRRELLSAVLTNRATGTQAGSTREDVQSFRDLVRSLDQIRDELQTARTACTPALCPEIQQIRRHQRTFLKSSQKFPDFIEVGIGVWERVQDWQLETARLPVTTVERRDGLYSLAFGMTTLVLRPDVRDDFIGFPYDRA